MLDNELIVKELEKTFQEHIFKIEIKENKNIIFVDGSETTTFSKESENEYEGGDECLLQTIKNEIWKYFEVKKLKDIFGFIFSIDYDSFDLENLLSYRHDRKEYDQIINEIKSRKQEK